MRRPARVLVGGQVAASASDREFPASTERSGAQRARQRPVVHHGRQLGALVLVVTKEWTRGLRDRLADNRSGASPSGYSRSWDATISCVRDRVRQSSSGAARIAARGQHAVGGLTLAFDGNATPVSRTLIAPR